MVDAATEKRQLPSTVLRDGMIQQFFCSLAQCTIHIDTKVGAV